MPHLNMNKVGLLSLNILNMIIDWVIKPETSRGGGKRRAE